MFSAGSLLNKFQSKHLDPEVRLLLIYLYFEITVKDSRHISLLILGQLEQINQYLFPLKSLKNHTFLDDFKVNYLINSKNYL